MFTLLLSLYRNKEQWAFKYPGQVTPTGLKIPGKRLGTD
jgi:stress response protein SCP2